MKKNYVKPVAEVNKFTAEDIMTTSGGGSPNLEGYAPDIDESYEFGAR